MIKQPHILNRGFCILLLLAFLQACSSSQGDVQMSPVQTGETEIVPTNTPFQPAIATSTYTLEVGTLSSATSDSALPSPTNPSDIASPGSVPTTQEAVDLTAVPPTQPPSDSTAPLPGGSPSVPTNTPDIPTAPPPPGGSVPTNTPDVPTAPPPGDPIIVIMPYDINAGGTLQIILGKFGVNENVTIDVHLGTRLNNLQDSFVVAVNSAGELTYNWTVPMHYAAGNYSILATGQTYHKHIAGYFQVQ